MFKLNGVDTRMKSPDLFLPIHTLKTFYRVFMVDSRFDCWKEVNSQRRVQNLIKHLRGSFFQK